jgi:hypothetical protein
MGNLCRYKTVMDVELDEYTKYAATQAADLVDRPALGSVDSQQDGGGALGGSGLDVIRGAHGGQGGQGGQGGVLQVESQLTHCFESAW